MSETKRSSPAISVVVPVHNRASLLPATLRSVLRQRTPVATEVIAVDDCSRDASAAIAESFGARVVRLGSNVGPGAARNIGIDHAHGEWVAFVDSDDVWAAMHLQTLWEARAGVAMVATSGLSVFPSGNRVYGSPFFWPVEVGRPRDILRPENIVNTSACMVRTDVLRSAGGFASGSLSEDLDLWMRVLSNHKGRVLPSLTVANRPHAEQTSRCNSATMESGAREVIGAAVARGLIDDVTAARLVSTMRWDSLRSSGESWPRVLWHLRPQDRYRLATLFLRRASMRHRWRLMPLRTRELRSLLDSTGSDAPSQDTIDSAQA